MASPTSRSLQFLRGLGYTAQVVEKWNAFSHKRIDLFGGIDIVAIHPEHQGVLGVQATTLGHIQERKLKCLMEPKLRVWMQAGNTLEIHGWGLQGKKGKRKVYHQKIIIIN